MDDSHNMKTLGNKQLGLHYEVIYQKIDNIKTEIIRNIADILGQAPKIGFEIYKDSKLFRTYCKNYESSIEKTKKDMLEILIQQEENIRKEIQRRQREMLKDIGITIPSLRVIMIMKETQ